jgi:hypothetical protein
MKQWSFRRRGRRREREREISGREREVLLTIKK